MYCIKDYGLYLKEYKLYKLSFTSETDWYTKFSIATYFTIINNGLLFDIEKEIIIVKEPCKNKQYCDDHGIDLKYVYVNEEFFFAKTKDKRYIHNCDFPVPEKLFDYIFSNALSITPAILKYMIKTLPVKYFVVDGSFYFTKNGVSFSPPKNTNELDLNKYLKLIASKILPLEVKEI